MADKPVKELKIENYFCQQIKAVFPEAEVLKFEVRRGEPDRIVLLPGGKALFVELKRPGKHPRPEQERALQRKRNLGFTAEYANTKETVDNLIESIK